MTWAQYIDLEAGRLAECRTIAQLNAELDRIETKVSGFNVPAGLNFWDSLAKRYEEKPKPLLKEAAASEKLNALVSAAQAIIQARGK